MEGKTVMEMKRTRSVVGRPEYGILICGLTGDMSKRDEG